MPHVDEGTLHALLDGALRAEAPERAREVEAHLETCADCRARLEQAAGLRDHAAGILDSLEPAAATGDFQEVVARAARNAAADERADDGEGVSKGASTADDTTGARSAAELRRRYRRTRGLAWAATIVVALGAGYMVRDLVGPLGQDSARLMTRSPAPATEMAEDARGDAAVPAGDEEAGPATGEAEAAVAQRRRAESASAPTSTSARAPEATLQTPTALGAASELDAREAGREAVEAEGAAAGMAEDRVPEALADAQDADRASGLVPNEPAADLAEASFAGAAMKATDAETDWVPAALEEAESRVGPILVLPEAEVAETELAADGAPVARTLQRLPGGVEVRVVQVPGQALEAAAQPTGDIPAAEPGAPAAERRQVAEMAPPPVVAELEVAPDSVVTPDSTLVVRTVHLVRDGVLLTLSGPLAAEALRALAAEAAPRTR